MDAALAQTLECVRDSAARRAPLRIRGGGTKDFIGPGAPHAAGEPLEMRALTGIVSYEPSELVVTARAGTPLAELEQLLASRGQCLPFEPPRFAPGGTVGGMVAAGLSGPARASVGALRDFVLGVEIINGKGELLRFGGQVMKNVAGYDVSRLMAGAWGQLGVITEVSLKVLPIAPAEATLRLVCDQAEALRRLNAWGGQPLPLNASRWADGALHLRLRGARAAVQAACAAIGGERLGDDEPQRWHDCRDQRLPWFAARPGGHALWRLSVPQSAPALALPEGVAAPLIEWHGGLRWVQAAPEHGPALRALAADAGGSASVFIAACAQGEGAEAVFDTNSAALAAIHRRLREAFDPAGIFNPGRVAG
jgi:glycolate oxidase FAD binding subunit